MDQEANRQAFQTALQTVFLDYLYAGGDSKAAHLELSRALGDLIWRIAEQTTYPLDLGGKVVNNRQEFQNFMKAYAVMQMDVVISALSGQSGPNGPEVVTVMPTDTTMH